MFKKLIIKTACSTAFFALFVLLPTSSPKAQTYSQSGGSVTDSNKTYSTSDADVSAVLVQNSGKYYLSNSSITKSGNTSSGDNSSFYGLNAGVLAKSASTIEMTNCTVTTDSRGANGVFAYGTGTNVNLSKCTITCTGQLGHAIMATGGGSMTAVDVDMLTTSTNSGAIATDRGGGTIDVTGGTVRTTGKDSPGIYSTGKITVTGADISASGSEAAVVEGANSIVLSDTKLSSTKAGSWGVLIYQSMSGDAEGTDGVFTMTGGSLSSTATTTPLFFITNSTGHINLNGVEVTVASDTLVYAAATSRWGTSGKNGGHAVLVSNGQTLAGEVVIDSYSTFIDSLKNSSVFTGAINNKNTASSTSVYLDASSKWILTANSYVDVVSDAAGISGTSITNITGNNFNIYYDATSDKNQSLGGKTYSLQSGGYLLPYGSTGVEESENTVPDSWTLYQNYPNPFNPTTTIKFGLPEASKVTITIYDLLGKEVTTIIDRELSAGYHDCLWNAASMPSGMYVYMIKAKANSGDKSGDFRMVKKMLLVK